MRQGEMRDKILDAAVKVFSREGYHRSRVADVAKEAGVAYGLVYHYFHSKEDLLEQIFKTKWSLFLAFLKNIRDDSKSTREKLLQIVRFLLSVYLQAPEIIKVIILEITRDAKFMKQEHLEEFRNAFEIIAEIIEEGVSKREVKHEVDPEVAALLFGGIIEVFFTAIVLGIISVTRENADEITEKIVDTFFYGLADSEKNERRR